MVHSPLGDFKYIGSTYAGIHTRFKQHITRFMKNNKECRSYLIFEKYGVSNCLITVILNCKCETQTELSKLERFHIKSNVCVNNKIPAFTHEDQIAYSRTYYLNNRDANSAIITCVCGKNHRQDGILRHSRTAFHKRFISG
jgi:Uri superfamily endonuclease